MGCVFVSVGAGLPAVVFASTPVAAFTVSVALAGVVYVCATKVIVSPYAAFATAWGRVPGVVGSLVHIACDGKGRPLSVMLTPGQRNDRT